MSNGDFETPVGKHFDQEHTYQVGALPFVALSRVHPHPNTCWYVYQILSTKLALVRVFVYVFSSVSGPCRVKDHAISRCNSTQEYFL